MNFIGAWIMDGTCRLAVLKLSNQHHRPFVFSTSTNFIDRDRHFDDLAFMFFEHFRNDSVTFSLLEHLFLILRYQVIWYYNF